MQKLIWKKNKSLIKTRLKQFYDKEAKKYYETRQKERKEFQYLLSEIQSYPQKKIRILEFWCGGWRFIKHLHESYKGEIEYVGVDLSSELLKYAQQDNPQDTFICSDISEYIQSCEQESFDFVVWTSSFQHIPSYKERLFLMKHFYRILKYGGKCLMLNWAFSDRFKKKYRKQVFLARVKWLFTFWRCCPRDIYVPRKNQKGEVQERFYHLFDLQEYKNLTLYSGFTLKESIFIDKNGSLTPQESDSNSSFFVVEKNPIVE